MKLGRSLKRARPQGLLVWFGACMVALMVLGGCGTDDTSGGDGASCSFDSDCAFGTVCSNGGECVEADCIFCSDPQETPFQVCTTPDDPASGTCTARQCDFNDECAGEAVCYKGLCVDEAPAGTCSSDADCEGGETCNLAGECVPDTSAGDCASSSECGEGEFCDLDAGTCQAGDCFDSTDCADGQTCDASNTCVDDGPQGCTPGSCGAGQTCNVNSGQCEDTGPATCDPPCAAGQHCEGTLCVDDCTPGSCGTGEVCNATTGKCESDGSNCPPGSDDPSSCVAPEVFDANLCACVECTDNSMCASGERCDGNGNCVPQCSTSCTSQTAQQDCSTGEPYCIQGCCVECIGNADCSSGQVCLDGYCGDAPDCSSDPSVCQSGYTCNAATGQCELNQPSGDCTTGNVTCPAGTICNPQTGQCDGAGGFGGGSCGFCDANCGCPSGLTCESTPLGQACVGCTPLVGNECSALGSDYTCSVLGLLTGEPFCSPLGI